MRDVKMGILEVVKGNAAPSRSLTSVVNVTIILEQEVVMDNLGGFSNAFAVHFGLLWSVLRTKYRIL